MQLRTVPSLPIWTPRAAICWPGRRAGSWAAEPQLLLPGWPLSRRHVPGSSPTLPPNVEREFLYRLGGYRRRRGEVESQASASAGPLPGGRRASSVSCHGDCLRACLRSSALGGGRGCRRGCRIEWRGRLHYGARPWLHGRRWRAACVASTTAMTASASVSSHISASRARPSRLEAAARACRWSGRGRRRRFLSWCSRPISPAAAGREAPRCASGGL